MKIDLVPSGNKIREMRKNRGLTQKDLAGITGFSSDTISRWERGDRSPRIKDLEIIASKLNVPIDDTSLSVLHEDRPESNLAPLNPYHQALIRVLPKEFSASCEWGNDWSWNSEAIDFESEQTDPDPELARYSPLVGMYVTGDSMEPDILDGDMVAFTDSHSDLEYAPNGSIVVVNYEGRMIVRGIFRKGNKVVLRAWNNIYKDIIVTPESDFKICGLVLKVYPGPKKPRSML
jgi:transcriptional regulator with XRE-family HTH domain